MGVFEPKLNKAATNSPTAFLPSSAESTKALKVLEDNFPEGRDQPAVIVCARAGGLTQSDRRTIFNDAVALSKPGVLKHARSPQVPFESNGSVVPGATQIGMLSKNGTTALVSVPMTSEIGKSMARAAERTAPAILSAGGTVITAMLVLLLADLKSTSTMGPVLAIGIAIMVLAGLTLLPALLAILGRGAFWPSIPRFGDTPRKPLGIWRRVGKMARNRPVITMAVTVAVLLAGALGSLSFNETSALEVDFRKETDSKEGSALIDKAFPAGETSPTDVIVDKKDAEKAATVLLAVPGVSCCSPRQ